MDLLSKDFWSKTSNSVLHDLKTCTAGLSQEEAELRLKQFGPNTLKKEAHHTSFALFLDQFKSPIIIILICAAILSIALGDSSDAIIIMVIVFVSGFLGFWQEKGAAGAVESLLETVETKVDVLRGGKQVQIPVDEIVPGDIITLHAGKGIPGDCRILESRDLFVNEAALTGETFPVEKDIESHAVDAPLAARSNSLFMGTHVMSGEGKAIVAATALNTEFGKISKRLKLRPAETEFERGIKKFGYLLMEVTLVLVVLIFAFNVYFAKPILDSLLFSLALAVGLTPQLLPVIISVNLANGAKRMAQHKVIVRRLSSIENFGSMNVLCSDKTGTLTDGTVRLKGAYDLYGEESEEVLHQAYMNSYFETGFISPIDEAIRGMESFDVSDFTKTDEVPYDFIRKRLSVLVRREKESHAMMITKGALSNILDSCTKAVTSDGSIVNVADVVNDVQAKFEEFSGQGFRVLGVSKREFPVDAEINKDDEVDMTFIGFLAFWDPPKEGIVENIAKLKALGVSLKVITGDNRHIAAKVGHEIGLTEPVILTGAEINQMRDEALVQRVRGVNIFAEIEPNQKEDIVLALKQAGQVVGYMGDGINDASALRAADVGISVDSAVDVAKETADIVLLEKDLGVLEHGVIEGRKTFANTLKYVFMATSANFGNMFSMAGASLFLPFLPLLPKQVLLTNLFTDLPEMTIATDNVDQSNIDRPKRWDIKFIKKFMIVFGIVSSVFDFMTFGVLLYILDASPEEFRTGWFLESIVSATMIVLVIRTRLPFYKSKPGKYLVFATLAVIAFVHVLPYSPIALILGFKPLPISFLVAMWIIVALYVVGAEYAKKLFYRNISE
ncbi:magnesium-translocating P-type ATPase [Maridesulfovibrio ferrireducens]|uniref:magnesium-translocating P-type ATPase n=1 Tax=Maridesulfovibrio ferrireducens TaxID=246191 RepID=UPI001A2255A2|nr:magnesium-translocating P-type ATPase [Maridesulfovibrio ferrireducens]MBI9110626.1 magnesium-translocating P-type ATPase [Maridesulfovibrio ferrireducens]